MNSISTTALSKTLNISSKALFQHLETLGLTKRENENWMLTAEGQQKGGDYKYSQRYGQYIVWPENFDVALLRTANLDAPVKTMTATLVGSEFGLSANKINSIFSELGWVTKGIKGWLVTDQGLNQGGIQAENRKSGVSYVYWPASIISVKLLTEAIDQVKGLVKPGASVLKLKDKPQPVLQQDEKSFRSKFKAEHRSTDGHFVRSKAEMLIDNWLYMAEIIHAYEPKLPIEESVYSDFYIPTGKVYIEYWGYESDPRYLARKQKKIDLYRKYEFNLIELTDKEVQNLDDVLPRLLLKYGVRAY